MSKSNMSKHWAGKGYNLPSKSPLKGAYSEGSDSQIYVSNRDVFDKFQKDMVNIAKSSITPESRAIWQENRADRRDKRKNKPGYTYWDHLGNEALSKERQEFEDKTQEIRNRSKSISKKMTKQQALDAVATGTLSSSGFDTLVNQGYFPKQQPESKTIKQGDFSKLSQDFDNMPGYQNIGKKSYKVPGYKSLSGVSLSNPSFKSPLSMKGDLDKDGKMSLYESKRQAAIEKNMKK